MPPRICQRGFTDTKTYMTYVRHMIFHIYDIFSCHISTILTSVAPRSAVPVMGRWKNGHAMASFWPSHLKVTFTQKNPEKKRRIQTKNHRSLSSPAGHSWNQIIQGTCFSYPCENPWLSHHIIPIKPHKTHRIPPDVHRFSHFMWGKFLSIHPI